MSVSPVKNSPQIGKNVSSGSAFQKNITLLELIQNEKQINEYFGQTVKNNQKMVPLAKQLLLEAIRKRKSKATHYNVAYVKHNRFLSPSQKREVTPKVTQIIPKSPQKLVIYGKPKVKLDQGGFGCVQHTMSDCYEEQGFMEQQNSNLQHHNGNPKNLLERENEEQEDQERQFLPQEYEQYLSPKQKNKNKDLHNKTVKNIKSPKSRNNNFKTIQIQQGKQNQSGFISSNRKVTSPRNHRMVTSPRCHENFANVQSKIKDLIERDKKNRQLQKQLQQQKNQISLIEQRQNELLLMQQKQKQELQHKKRQEQSSKITINKRKFQQCKESFSSSSLSQDSTVNLHNHRRNSSRIKCYDCQIERLQKRKEKARVQMEQLERKQYERQKVLQQMYRNSEYNCSQNPAFQGETCLFEGENPYRAEIYADYPYY